MKSNNRLPERRVR